MKLYRRFWMSALLLSACTHSPSREVASTEAAPRDYQANLEKQVAESLERDPAFGRDSAQSTEALQVLKARLGTLNMVKPGKFEIYVFPKIRSTNHKERRNEGEVLLGHPRVMEVTIPHAGDCKSLIADGRLKKLNPKEYFPASLAQGSNTCAIVSVVSKTMKELNRSLLRDGDAMAKRLYIDGNYQVHGLETDYHSDDVKGKLKKVRVKMEAGSPTTSGFDFLPVDLPAMSSLPVPKLASTKEVFVDLSAPAKNGDFTYQPEQVIVDRMAVRQIQKINQKFTVPTCPLRKLTYKDLYHRPVKMFWCEGVPWPQVVESVHFVSVTGNLSVSGKGAL